MGSLKDGNPKTREFLTETLNEADWGNTLNLVVTFLLSKGAKEVGVEFGYIYQLELRGKPQPENQIVALTDLESFIGKGLQEGTIEWNSQSDFLFSPIGVELRFMLCNDADLHFASPNSVLLTELGRTLNSAGIKVYDSGTEVQQKSPGL